MVGPETPPSSPSVAGSTTRYVVSTPGTTPVPARDEDQVRALLGQVEAGEAVFLLLEDPADPSGRTFIQTMPARNGTWLVEDQRGSSDPGHRGVAPDLDHALAWICGWAGWDLPPTVRSEPQGPGSTSDAS